MENFYSRCLLCTCTPDMTPHLNIFSEAGSQLQLPEKINKYLNIQIVPELPQNVCHSCMEKLEVTHDLVMSSQRAWAMLLQIKQQIDILDQEQILMHDSVSNCTAEDIDYSAGNHGTQLDENPTYISDCTSTKDTPIEVLQVSFLKCPQPNNFQGDLTFHEKERDGDLMQEEQNEITTVEGKEDMEGWLTTLDMTNTVGDFEARGFPPQETNIIYEEYGSALKCDICSEWQNDIYSLIHHKNKMHITNFNFDCEHCEKSFSNLKQIRGHIRNMHTIKDHVCEVCGKSFTKWSYSKHLRWHRRHAYARQVRKLLNTCMETKQCGMCNHRVKNKYSILTHINSKHLDVVVEPLPFWCDLCNKEFSNQQNLMRHLHNVHKPKLQCNFCDKLITRKNITKHLKLHLQLCNSNGEKYLIL
ncbi:hypothetical protein B566_EDAN013510 [Ephemera danica]|nr:hypothetical protein B566_EDAN013510 [Ephemera danica]